MNNIIKTVFTTEMHQFLIDEGYTHIYNKGVIEVDESGDGDEFILKPLNTSNLKFHLEQFPEKVEVIKNSDIYDMSEGDPFISFMVEIPLDEFQRYLNRK